MRTRELAGDSPTLLPLTMSPREMRLECSIRILELLLVLLSRRLGISRHTRGKPAVRGSTEERRSRRHAIRAHGAIGRLRRP